MRWLDRLGDQAEALTTMYEFQKAGRVAAALRAAEQALRTLTNPYARVEAHIRRVIALVDLGRTSQFTAALDEAFAAARELAEPYPLGHLHALAALASRQLGATERSVTHLVYAERALTGVQDVDRFVVWGWHDLAMAYSYLGFHSHALRAMERAREIGAVPPELFSTPGMRLRMALSMDHQGDGDGCLRVLRDLTGELDPDLTGRMRPASRVACGYALARQAVLDRQPTSAQRDPRPLLAAGAEGQRPRDMKVLGEVCLMIGAGKATDALTRLDAVTVSPDTFGPAEQTRLRSLAFAAAGDHAAAHEADRHAFRLAAQRVDRLRDVFLEGIAARLDQEDLRRAVAHHDVEPLVDPLTGLPNRRHLEHYLAAMTGRGDQAMVGTVDLDGLAAVNHAHGQISGDLVLQRVAGVVARVLRRGDFVARSGGDEFAVVLPHASPEQAAHVARRVTEAVGAEDWAALVPGARIGVTVTWEPR